jgi:MFS family permease
MIIHKLFTKISDRELKENIAWGLACGLAGGLAGGLACGLAGGLAGGLVGGLACGLVGGLAWGLAWGLAGGLAGGLVCGLACGLAGGLVIGLVNFNELWSNYLSFGIIVFILLELFFWMDSKKIGKKENRLLFTLKRKSYALFDALLIVVNVLNVRWLLNKTNINKEDVLYWIGQIGYYGLIVIGIVLILLVYVWLNSLKYRGEPKR